MAPSAHRDVGMLVGKCKPAFQPLSNNRWRNAQRLAMDVRDPLTASRVSQNLLQQVGVSPFGSQPLGQQLRVALLLTGQLRSLPSPEMRTLFRSAIIRLRQFVDLHIVASVELTSGPPTKAAAKLNLASAGGSNSRWQWIGARFSEEDVRRLLAEWGASYRLAFVPATADGLARNVSRMMQRFGRSPNNASALMGFDPHEGNAQLATQWWKLALAYEELLHAEAEVGRFDFVLKIRPDVCPQGLTQFGPMTIATLRRERYIAWLNLDFMALLPRYAAPYYFRWAMLQCINGRFQPPEHGPRANDLQSSMAASGVPVAELSRRNPLTVGTNAARAHMVTLLRGCIVRTVSRRRPTKVGEQTEWATAWTLGAGRSASTCAWVPPELWMESRRCAPMRCE